MKDLTVREVLKEYKGKAIKLGGATGFIFCSVVDDDTIKVIREASRKELKSYRQVLKDAENRRDNFKARWNTRTANAIKVYNANVRDGFKPQYESVADLKAKHVELQRRENMRNASEIPNYTQRIANFKPILDRKVTEIYPSMVNDDETIIIFEGDTTGMYWDREEYESKKLGVNKRVRHDAVERAILRGLKI